MADQNADGRKSNGLSFGFSKKQEVRKLSKSIVNEGTEGEKADKDFVISLEGKKVNSSLGADNTNKHEEYVIPLIRQNKWRRGETQNESKRGSSVNDNNSLTDSLDDQAVKEILEETAIYNESWKGGGKVENTTLAIPLLMQNKVPDGFESDDKLDVALRPSEPDDADYEHIPIEHFGAAMLRGMGWKEGRGIGKNGKVFTPVEAQLRPKGLGLGADRGNTDTDSKATKGNAAEQENLVLKQNAMCVMTTGVDKGLYGIVEGLDEDNARVMVKLALSGKVVSVLTCNVRVVSKSEYEKCSKYLNKQKVDKYKEDEEKRKEQSSRTMNGDSSREKSHKKHKRTKYNDSDSECGRGHSKHKRKKHSEDGGDRGRKHSHRHRHSEARGSSSKKVDRVIKSNEHKHKSEDSNTSDSESDSVQGDHQSKNERSWLRNDLRVRIIDKDFQKGKYYKEKVIIVDVPHPESCVCKTDDGKVIDGIGQNSLETVIPRSDNSYIAIVMGSDRGQIGEVMKRDKDRCMALVQLLSDRDVVLKLRYDEICEFVGDVRSYDL